MIDVIVLAAAFSLGTFFVGWWAVAGHCALRVGMVGWAEPLASDGARRSWRGDRVDGVSGA